MVLLKKSQLATATALVIGCNASLAAQAQVFPAALDLADLDGINGFVLNGAAANDFSGTAVSAADDFNGEGIDDLIIGAPEADPNGSSSGRSYVVFGSDSGLPDPFELSSLNGSNGFVINGEAARDNAVRSVSAAGDINGDGVDDLTIGARYADPNGSSSGRSYVVFGRGDSVFIDRFEDE